MGLATAVAIGGLAISAGSTAMSFMQASEQKGKQRQAEADAAKAMAEARKKLEINFTDEMAIQKEPYELQREAMLSSGAQAIEAGVESERGAAATAGKVQMAQNEAQAGIRTEMGKEMTDIENKRIAEESRLRDLGVQLDLGEVEGQQMQAQNAQSAAAASTAAGFQGITATAQKGLDMLPLFFGEGKEGNITTSAPPGGSINTVNPAYQSSTSDRFKPLFTNNTEFSNPFQPNLPKPGTKYGMFGVDFNGVGGY